MKNKLDHDNRQTLATTKKARMEQMTQEEKDELQRVADEK